MRFHNSNKWNNLMFQTPAGKRHNLNEHHSSNITVIAGNWIEAVGTIISAIGSTPSTIFSEQTLTDFNLIGNILEAGGIAIAAKTEDSLLNNVGDELQAIGNIVVVASILTNNEQLSQQLETQGDLLQVVGTGITINTQGKLTLLETIANTGNIIQLIGNVIQVFANTDTQEGIIMNAVGAWTQAVGAVTTALASD
ncbi:MAG: hypothetical protein ABS949_16200 [Solibacillus sp.]